jgi:hypothetical protein
VPTGFSLAETMAPARRYPSGLAVSEGRSRTVVSQEIAASRGPALAAGPPQDPAGAAATGAEEATAATDTEAEGAAVVGEDP